MAKVISLFTTMTVSFLANLSFQSREISSYPEKERRKRGQNQDDFGIVMQSRRNTMKGIYMYQAEKKVKLLLKISSTNLVVQ